MSNVPQPDCQRNKIITGKKHTANVLCKTTLPTAVIETAVPQFQFVDLPLLATFALRKGKSTTYAQKTSNRTYVTLPELVMERSKKSMEVVPFDYCIEVVRVSFTEPYNPKLEAQQKRVDKAAQDVEKASKALEARRAKLEKLKMPKPVVVKAPKSAKAEKTKAVSAGKTKTSVSVKTTN
jgi:hypothetical protein